MWVYSVTNSVVHMGTAYSLTGFFFQFQAKPLNTIAVLENSAWTSVESLSLKNNTEQRYDGLTESSEQEMTDDVGNDG